MGWQTAGERTVGMDLNSRSNFLTYAVTIGEFDVNNVRIGRPKFRTSGMVRDCRETAPASGDVMHQIADHLFESPSSEVFGWQTLFGALSGCRTSELLRLGLDAKSPSEPGFADAQYLFLGRRSKSGVSIL
jgi:hypothetical protein